MYYANRFVKVKDFCGSVEVYLCLRITVNILIHHCFTRTKTRRLWPSFNTRSFCARCRDKGKESDPCVCKLECTFCNVLTPFSFRYSQLQNQEEKRDLKEKSEKSDTSVDTSSSLVDPALVSVVGVVDSQGMLQSCGSSVSKEKKKQLTSPDHNSKSDTIVNRSSHLQTSLSNPPVVAGQPSLLQMRKLMPRISNGQKDSTGSLTDCQKPGETTVTSFSDCQGHADTYPTSWLC